MQDIKEGFALLWELLVLIYVIICQYWEACLEFFVKPPLKSLAGEVILVILILIRIQCALSLRTIPQITGGSNGIGREVALQLASSGAKIVSWDVDEVANKFLVNELKSLGCDAVSDVVDVSVRTEVEAAAKRVII